MFEYVPISFTGVLLGTLLVISVGFEHSGGESEHSLRWIGAEKARKRHDRTSDTV